MEYENNAQGDTIEVHADGIILNLNYWDCQCDNDYIKPVAQHQCDNCGCHIDDCPSSREDEVKEYYKELLYDTVLAQIKDDVTIGDLTAIAELLRFIPDDKLKGYLRED